ncbi:MAG: antitoxin component YwqK of YwqJK toxin-antitoxin module [Glaciecola sp.]|jgi:antitoxin component YwqK of YwqJK toxin-antitoxin module
MTNKLLLFFSLIISVSTFAQDDINQVDAKGKKHGQWIVKHKNGKIKHETNFVHGTASGLSMRYNTGGKKTSKMMLSNNGTIARGVLFHNNGNIMADGKYSEKKKDSTWNFYALSGVKIRTEKYNNGILNGQLTTYYKNGNIKAETTYNKGIAEGLQEEFYANGNIRSSKKVVGGKTEGPFKLYYDNKVYRIIGHYANGKKNGKWKYYSPRLKVEKEERYEYGNLIYSSNEILSYWDDSTKVVRTRERYNKSGRSSLMAYHPNGKISREGYYFKNKKDSTWKYFDKFGQLESIKTFYKGKKNGHWTFYYPDGQVWKELSWYKNKLEGERKDFHENGKIKLTGQYNNGVESGSWSHYDTNGTLLKSESKDEK